MPPRQRLSTFENFTPSSRRSGGGKGQQGNFGVERGGTDLETHNIVQLYKKPVTLYSVLLLLGTGCFVS